MKKSDSSERKKGPLKAVHKKEENKENSNENSKKNEIVGQSAHKVGSAMDLVNSNTNDKTKKAKTPIKSLPMTNNKQRTLSHSSSASSASSASATKAVINFFLNISI